MTHSLSLSLIDLQAVSYLFINPVYSYLISQIINVYSVICLWFYSTSSSKRICEIYLLVTIFQKVSIQNSRPAYHVGLRVLGNNIYYVSLLNEPNHLTNYFRSDWVIDMNNNMASFVITFLSAPV